MAHSAAADPFGDPSTSSIVTDRPAARRRGPWRRRRSAAAARHRATRGGRASASSTPAPPCACSDCTEVAVSPAPYPGSVATRYRLAATCWPASQPTRSPNRGASHASGRLVVPMRCGSVERRAVGEIVQRGGEHQLVVGAVVDGAGGGLQGVVEFVDGFLVPHAPQGRQQGSGVGERVHVLQHTPIGLYQLLTCCSLRATSERSRAVFLSRKGHRPCE